MIKQKITSVICLLLAAVVNISSFGQEENSRFIVDVPKRQFFPIPDGTSISDRYAYKYTLNLRENENMLELRNIEQETLLFFSLRDAETDHTFENENGNPFDRFGPVYSTEFRFTGLQPNKRYSITVSSPINDTDAAMEVYAGAAEVNSVKNPDYTGQCDYDKAITANTLTRAEMACMIRDTLPEWRPIRDYASMSFGSKEEPPIYEDVPNDYYAQKEIQSLMELGIFNGVGNGAFMPERNSTYIEAVTALVRMLFYTPYAQKNGGYPNGYWQEGVKLGLIESDWAMDEEVSREMFEKMLDKAVNTPILLTKSVCIGGENSYEIKPDITYRSVFGIR